MLTTHTAVMNKLHGIAWLLVIITGLRAALYEWSTVLIPLFKECMAKAGEHESRGCDGAVYQPSFG